jgi:hypothetical protein
MSVAQGQPAHFRFWNLSPSKSYFVKLTSGATYSGAIFQTDSIFTNVVVNGQQLSFDTTDAKHEWLSGSLSVGLMINWGTFEGEANIAAPVVMQVDCLGSATTQHKTFSVGIGFEVPPTCVVCGAGPEMECPGSMQLCGYMGRFFCCRDCPDKP